VPFMVIIFGCEKPIERLEKFVFDGKQIATRDVYRYEFDEKGRIKTAFSTTFWYMGGAVFDSSNSVKDYEYNDKGQIVRIFDSIDSTLQTKLYNDLDSLIGDYTVDNYGDTLRMTVTTYSKGKSHRTYDRMLFVKPLENSENVKNEDLRNYDTLSSTSELIYEGENHTKSLTIEKDGTVSQEIQFFYENGRKAKAITFSFIGEEKFISATTTYIENNTNEPDAITVGPQGEGIGVLRTIFQDQGRIVINEMAQMNMQDIIYYDKNGRRTGNVLMDFNEKVKHVRSYTYDKKGNVIEEADYSEKIIGEQ
jgi:hypothetical protein